MASTGNASADSGPIDSVHELAFFYLDLLDELGLDRVTVIGAGLGGWLAADLATIDPRRVRRLVLAGDPGRFERYLRNRSATAHLGWNPYLHDPKLPRRLHRITAPALILWGAQDRLRPAGHARRWAELIPGAELAIIEDAGHSPLVEQASASVQAIRDFCGES